jgi:UDP-3-O-[3-hydroxymyristoyl] glucosamine N-acyltransferase
MILQELAARLGCTLRGEGTLEVHRVAGIEDAGPGDLTFVANPRYVARLGDTRASAVIVHPDLDTPLPSLLTPNPYLAFARAVEILHPQPRPAAGVHPSAQVDPTACLGEGTFVGPLAVVGPRVRVGARTVLHAHVVLHADVQVGDDCILHSGVHVREGCRLGHRVIVQNGAVLGADGFGFARDAEGRYQKIPQVGIVVVEDDVEIGALVAIDRAALRETRIGRGTKIDNLVQIGHSVTIGEDTVLAGQVGIAGSTRLGRRVTLAGQVGVAGHLTLGDGVIATAQTGIPHSLDDGAFVSGYPAVENRAWLKSSAVFTRLPELQRRVRELERSLAELRDLLARERGAGDEPGPGQGSGSGAK